MTKRLIKMRLPTIQKPCRSSASKRKKRKTSSAKSPQKETSLTNAKLNHRPPSLNLLYNASKKLPNFVSNK